MKTNTANTTPARRTVRNTLGPALLLTAAALLLQGCTTARPAWADKTDTNPLARSAFERTEPREGLVVLSLKF